MSTAITSVGEIRSITDTPPAVLFYTTHPVIPEKTVHARIVITEDTEIQTTHGSPTLAITDIPLPRRARITYTFTEREGGRASLVGTEIIILSQ